jgi:hemerythrin-like domain-containing protein
MVDLVETLLAQHEAGRRVTATVLKLAPNSRTDGDDRRDLKIAMQSFIAMYRPHAAREDTDLFPKLHELVSKHEYDAMAEDFERKERRLFGEDSFEKMADRVAKLEEAIHALLIPEAWAAYENQSPATSGALLNGLN